MNPRNRPLISGLLCASTVALCVPASAKVSETPEPARPSPSVALPSKPDRKAEPAPSSPAGEKLLPGRTDREIEQWEKSTKDAPDDADGWVGLAEAYLQKSRETNDPLFYSKMDAALTRAQKLKPDSYTGMKLRSLLHSSRHEFDEAIEWTKKAMEANPQDPLNYGILGDIYAERGEYEKVEDNYQKMLDLLPGRASYSRASYLAELYGDERSARMLMEQAIGAGPRKGEGAAWCHAYLGHLYFIGGGLPAAQRAYEDSLAAFPGYFHALMGLGKVKAARKEFPAAIETYRKALQSGPHHEALAALIEIYTHTGQKERAKEVRAQLGDLQERYRKYDMDIDFEVAEIDAESGRDLANALKLAKEEVKTHGNVKAYDSLAWIAYLNGDMETAQSAMEKALGIGTQYPVMLYHAGKIREKLGDKQGSIRLYHRALSQCPYFHIRYAEDARKSIERLSRNLASESRTAEASETKAAGK